MSLGWPRRSRRYAIFFFAALVVLGSILFIFRVTEEYTYICLVCGRTKAEYTTRSLGIPLYHGESPWDHTTLEENPHLYDKLIGTAHEHSYHGGGYTRCGHWPLGLIVCGMHSLQHDPSGNGVRPQIAGSVLPLYEKDPHHAKLMYMRVLGRLKDATDAEVYVRARELARSGSREDWEQFAPESP